MAATKTSKSVIDNLPEVQRRKVVDALLAGRSLRDVSKLAGVSAPQVNAYKKKVLLPALRSAQEIQSFQPLASTNKEALQQQASITRDIIRASPFRDRLQNLWERTERSLDKAENCEDVTAMAPLLNAAMKNVELLGRVTGELDQVTTQIAVQIVMPATQIAAQQAEADLEFIDIGE